MPLQASKKQLILAGGDFLGSEWARVRMEQDRLLLPAAAAALEAPASSTFRPPPAKPYVAPVKKPVARLAPGQESPEQIELSSGWIPWPMPFELWG